MSRTITGLVHSDRGDKTIVVRTAMTKTHPIYKKQYKRNRKFMAHDEKNEARIGDLVIIRETRPLSAKKHFILEKVIEKATSGYQETDAESDVPLIENETKTEEKKPIKNAGEEQTRKHTVGEKS